MPHHILEHTLEFILELTLEVIIELTLETADVAEWLDQRLK